MPSLIYPKALIEFIAAREDLRKRKEAAPTLDNWPIHIPHQWTPDPILHEYRFCNVRRRDDRVSRWLRKHIMPSHRHPEFLEFAALCRWVNWPPTIHEIMNRGLFPADGAVVRWNVIIGLIDERTKDGEKTWTGAYMVRANDDERSKATYIVNDVVLGGIKPVKAALLAIMQSSRSRQAVWRLLEARKYWGSFMAGQVVDDLTWTPLLSNPVDDFTWAPMGPGSQRGYNRLLHRDLKAKIAEEEWNGQLIRWRQDVIEKLGPEYEDLTLMDLQNCLCETDKYLRAKTDTGRPRSRYRPETAYQV